MFPSFRGTAAALLSLFPNSFRSPVCPNKLRCVAFWYITNLNPRAQSQDGPQETFIIIMISDCSGRDRLEIVSISLFKVHRQVSFARASAARLSAANPVLPPLGSSPLSKLRWEHSLSESVKVEPTANRFATGSAPVNPFDGQNGVSRHGYRTNTDQN